MSIIQLAAGKTKTVTASTEPNNVILTFRDDITAGDGKKHDVLLGKGKVNATITSKLYGILAEQGIPTHLLKTIDSNRLLVRKLEMIPVEVVCRIRAAGHFVGVGKYFQSGDKLPFPVVEFYLKDDAHHDPMLNDQHLELLRLSKASEVEKMRKITLEAAHFLDGFFDDRGAILVDFKLEFGTTAMGT